MLNQSQCYTVKVNDGEGWKEVVGAMDKLEIGAGAQDEMAMTLSALLLMGNVTFEQDDNDRADITNRPVLEAVEKLLGVENLTSQLTTRTVQRGGAAGKRVSTYTVEFNKSQAEAARDAVIKSIYTHLFDWVVSKVNGFISGSEGARAAWRRSRNSEPPTRTPRLAESCLCMRPARERCLCTRPARERRLCLLAVGSLRPLS